MHMGDREARPSSFSEASATVNRQQGVMQNFRSLFAPYSASASSSLRPRGGGVLPYMAYTGMYRWTGCGLWPLCPKQGM